MSSSQNILTLPLNVNSEDIIKKLKCIRFSQGATLEELFKDYNSLSTIVKQQQQQERQHQFIKLQSQQTLPKLLASNQNYNANENEESSSAYHNDYEEALRVEYRKTEDKLQKDINRLAQLESQNKNLRDESALKSQNFQSNIREMIAEARQLQFERVSINQKVSFAECSDGIVYMCEMESPYQTIRGVQYSERSLNALGVSVERDCNVKSLSVFKQTICVAYHSKEVELFQMEQNNSRRLCGIEAHLQQIQFACLIDSQLILTAGINKNILKLWSDKGKLLKSFKTQAYPTAVTLIHEHIPFKSPQDQSKSDQLLSYSTNIQLAVGFSDGTVKLLELAGSSDSESLETITNWSLNQIHEIQIVPQTSIAAQDCSIKTIQIAYNSNAEKSSLLHQSIKGFQNNFGLKSRMQQQPETISINNFTIASTIQGDNKSIFVAILSKDKVFNISDYPSPAVSSVIFCNTSNSKYFSLTPEYLIAGSSQGNIHIWDLRGLNHPLMFYTPQMELKAVIPVQQNEEILLAQYDLHADELVTVDAQGNILKWEQFIGELEKQKKQGIIKSL